MSLLHLPRAAPQTVLFDWHATLVDTHDAMYLAVDEVLPKLQELGLEERLVPAEEARSVDDARLVKYVREHGRLHPRITEQRKISRTDIFEVLFGPDEEAKRRAHQAFDAAYRRHLGVVHPLELDAYERLEELRGMGIDVGLLSNRSREFMEHELARLENGRWWALFDTLVCGDDVPQRKPAPDLICGALERLGHPVDEHCWYVGDSTTDVVAAKRAGVTAVFYNGAHWSPEWLAKIFPMTVRHPHEPDTVVEDLRALNGLARYVLAQESLILDQGDS